MLRKTTTILAVAAAVTAAACGGTAGSDGGHQASRQELADELSRTSLADAVDQRDHFSPLCDGDGYPLPGNVNSKGAHPTTVAELCSALGKGEPKPGAPPAPTTGTAPTPPPAPAPAACDKNSLNQELSNQLLESALANHTAYRCLCDDKGYPLVGNINSKGTTASAFCKALVDKGLL